MNHDQDIETLMKKIRLDEQQQSEREQALPQFTQPDKLLTYLKTNPVQKTVPTSFLSFFLRRFRIRTKFSIDSLATALDVTPDILKQFESSANLPWDLPVAAMAKIASGYRLHIDSITALTKNCYELARVSDHISDPNI